MRGHTSRENRESPRSARRGLSIRWPGLPDVACSQRDVHPFQCRILIADAPRILRVLPSCRLSCPGRGSRCSRPSSVRRRSMFPLREHGSYHTEWSVPHAIVKAPTPRWRLRRVRSGSPGREGRCPPAQPRPVTPARASPVTRVAGPRTDCIGESSLAVEELSPPGPGVPDLLVLGLGAGVHSGARPVVANLFKGLRSPQRAASVWRRITVPPLGAGMPARAADD